MPGCPRVCHFCQSHPAEVWVSVYPCCVFCAPAAQLTGCAHCPSFSSFLNRLTDPIPTTETSIAPRQRPKAGQTQPNPGILPIQPALTPRKRATAQAAIQPQGERVSVCPLLPRVPQAVT